jgi:ABC-type dipeptide/oligopeptide/nickel transport system permease component
MARYILIRALSLSLSLVVASVVIFALIEVIPGDPASFMLGLNATDETLAALRAELGLDGSKVERYFAWIGGMLTGDFGTSYTYRVPVSELVLDRLWVSLPLAVYALTLSTLIAFPVGILAAANRGGILDYGVMGGTQLGIAIPNFWFAMLLVLLFAVTLQWFSAGGFPGMGGPRRGDQVPDPARHRAGAAAGLHPRPRDALGAAGDARSGLHPHRPGQGPLPPPGRAAPRTEERADPGADDHRVCSFPSCWRARSSSRTCSSCPVSGG